MEIFFYIRESDKKELMKSNSKWVNVFEHPGNCPGNRPTRKVVVSFSRVRMLKDKIVIEVDSPDAKVLIKGKGEEKSDDNMFF